MQDLRGGCQCGGLRHSIAAPPLAHYACHRLECQKQSGSACGLSMPMARGRRAMTETGDLAVGLGTLAASRPR